MREKTIRKILIKSNDTFKKKRKANMTELKALMELAKNGLKYPFEGCEYSTETVNVFRNDPNLYHVVWSVKFRNTVIRAMSKVQVASSRYEEVEPILKNIDDSLIKLSVGP